MTVDEPGPATESMRLRKPARRGRPVAEVEQEELEAIERTSAVQGARALDELLNLHSSALVGLCRECLTPHPCSTRRLLEVVAGTPTTPEERSQ